MRIRLSLCLKLRGLSLYSDEAALRCVYRCYATDLSDDGLVSLSDTGGHFDVELIELGIWRDKPAKRDIRGKTADRNGKGRRDLCETVSERAGRYRRACRSKASSVQNDCLAGSRWRCCRRSSSR